MIGSLLVTLPSSYKGGSVVIEHQGEQVTYRRTRQPLSFIAFYADCQHEIRPIKEGHRVALTYNLLLEGDAADQAPPQDTTDALAERLRAHFQTPPSPRFAGDPRGGSAPPRRLVHLLDHQYTDRGLAASRLKQDDAARVAALREAATRTDCEMARTLLPFWHQAVRAEGSAELMANTLRVMDGLADAELAASLLEPFRIEELKRFLSDGATTELEWPLNKEDRKHVHGIIDMHELPVTHETRRQGRPYTLILTKTEALFEREVAERKRWQKDLEWLRKQEAMFTPSS